jgi:hypothetical protein
MGRVSNPSSPILRRRVSQPNAGFSPFVAMCFTVNYIMGTGFLTLPLAFSSAGLGLSLLTLAVVCYLSDVSKNFMLEAMARSNALLRTEASPDKADAYVYPTGEASSLLHSREQEAQVVAERTFEVVEMCRMYLGRRGRAAYMVTLFM